MSNQHYLEPVEDGLVLRPAGSWTQVKLDYVGRYINAFIRSMKGQRFRAFHYIDLFSGPGKCSLHGTHRVILGSPLLALTACKSFTRWFFVDASQENADALHARCSASRFKVRVSISAGDANALVGDVVETIRKVDKVFQRGLLPSLNLAFLDPEGLELRWSTVEQLASLNRMDLIFLYPQGGLDRYFPEASAQTGETAIDAYFGDRYWRAVCATVATSQQVHRQLVDHLKEKLAGLGYVDVHSTEEPIVRNVKHNAPLYRLIFACKHQRGNEFWEDILKHDAYGQRRLLEASTTYSR